MAESEFLVRDTRLPGHFWADNEVMDIFGPLLGAHGLAVYMALCRTAINGTGECKVSRRRIAKQLSISAGGAHNALELIVKLSLARLVQEGTPRTPAVYVLADVKSLCNPEMAQLRLGNPLTSVHGVNAQAKPSVHGVNANDHPVNAKTHGVNAAFMERTPNKEDKTSSILKTERLKPPNPLSSQKGGIRTLTTRQLKELRVEMDWLRMANGKDFETVAANPDCLKCHGEGSYKYMSRGEEFHPPCECARRTINLSREEMIAKAAAKLLLPVAAVRKAVYDAEMVN